MDLNDFRSLWTLCSFIAFIGVVVWAYSARQKPRFEAAARLPLEDDFPHSNQP